MIASILALALLDAGPPPLGAPQPWPTSVDRPATVAPMRDLLVEPLPTMTPRIELRLPFVGRLVAMRAPTKTPTATVVPLPRPTDSPEGILVVTEDQFRREVAKPGRWVIIGPNLVLSRDVQVATGVRITGQGQSLIGYGLKLYKVRGVVIEDLVIERPDEDGISINASTGTLIQNVTIEGPAGDGGIDIVSSGPDGGSHTLRNVTIRNVVKANLIGHQNNANDQWLHVGLENVNYIDSNERTPKVHRAQVAIRGGSVYHWVGPRLDLSIGAAVSLQDTTWYMGPKSMPGFGRGAQNVIDLGGNVLVPWRGGQ